MPIKKRLLIAVVTLVATGFSGLSQGQEKAPAPSFPFQLPSGLPFIPLAPQPGAVPINSEGWRSVIAEYGPPVKGVQAKIVEDAVAELSRAAGFVAPQGGYRGTLLDTSVLNAFAIGDGNVFVTRQLLAYMNDEDELIGVMGHEVGHVIGGHSRFKAATNAAQSGSDFLFGTFLPPLRGAAMLGSNVVTRGFSRSQEHAADVAGIKFLADLGRDPNAMARALGILDADSKLEGKIFGSRPPGALDYWLNTHPIHSERISLVQTAAGMAPRGKPAPHRSRETFIRELDGLMFDDSPEQGIVDGPKFRHPGLKLALDAAPTFRLLNGTQALMVKGPGESSATLKMIAGRGAPTERFKAAWAKSFPAELAAPTPEVGQIGGIASASGFVEKRVNDEPVVIAMWLYAWSDTQSFIYVAVDPKGANTSQHLATAQSLRRLSDGEVQTIKVRRLSVADIAPGDTVASLSRRMAYSDFREERFRLINGLFNGEPLPKTGPIKIVVWAAR